MNEKANKRSEPKFTGQVKMYPISCRPECQQASEGEIEKFINEELKVFEVPETDMGETISRAITYIKQLQRELEKTEELLGEFEGGWLRKKEQCEQLQGERDRLKDLLGRVKETFEPMPIIGDLKAMRKMLAEARISPKEKKITKQTMQKHERENRKLYNDIVQALKGKQ